MTESSTALIELPAAPAGPGRHRERGGGAILAAEEFFLAGLRNPHTRRAYSRHVIGFLEWCDQRGTALAAVTPGEATAWFETLNSVATQRMALAALRRFFSLLVTRHAVLLNPFDSLQGPRLDSREPPRRKGGPHHPRTGPAAPREHQFVPPRRAPGPRRHRDSGGDGSARRRYLPPPDPGSTGPRGLTLLSSGPARSGGSCETSPYGTTWTAGSMPTCDSSRTRGTGTVHCFGPLALPTPRFAPRPMPPATIRAMLKRRLRDAELALHHLPPLFPGDGRHRPSLARLWPSRKCSIWLATVTPAPPNSMTGGCKLSVAAPSPACRLLGDPAARGWRACLVAPIARPDRRPACFLNC